MSLPDRLFILISLGGVRLTSANSERIECLNVDPDGDDDFEPYFYYNGLNREPEELPALTDGAWEVFRARLEELGVFEWQGISPDELYDDMVTDEVAHWSIAISDADGTEFELSGLLDRLPQWFGEFLKAASALVGGRPFGTVLERR